MNSVDVAIKQGPLFESNYLSLLNNYWKIYLIEENQVWNATPHGEVGLKDGVTARVGKGNTLEVAKLSSAIGSLTSDSSLRNANEHTKRNDYFEIEEGLLTRGFSTAATRNGSSRDDFLFGTNSSDRMNGFAGDDWISGSDGEDWIYGGTGNDRLYGDGGSDYIQGDQGNDQIFGGNGNDRLIAGYGSDIVHGDGGDDILFGLAGNNYLFGDDGSDILYSGTGENWIIGGSGEDLVSYKHLSNGGVQVSLFYDENSRAYVKKAGGVTDVLIGIENVQGTKYDDSINGNNQDNEIYGGAGDDFIAAEGGADYVNAGAGDDVVKISGDGNYVRGGDGRDEIHSQGGNNVLNGEDGIDLISYHYVKWAEGYTRPIGVHVDLDQKRATFAEPGARNSFFEELHNFENVEGSIWTDFIFGDSNRNVLRGLGGDDYLSGRDGDDILVGGEGDDYLIGGNGSDAMAGKKGADTFVFSKGIQFQADADIILDFEVGIDRLDLSDHSAAVNWASAQDVLDNCQSNGSRGTIITLGRDTIELALVDTSDILSVDFIL
ncbi:calcium-binding protein [Pseudovibrio sp. Alg231-02]|uniref:calcium-binding protein n=1 Tax=Pseudovibrio sp. Alg231-02 TaxID=1922223 RepID=UPI000D559700|nr:calcium-binding protein [Pseudovibrio sp. Alg231-02]